MQINRSNLEKYGAHQILRYNRDVERYERELAKGWDVVLEPQPLVSLDLILQASDNWGYAKHEADEYAAKIDGPGKPVLFVVFDTGRPRSNYLQDVFLPLGINHTTDPDEFDGHNHSSHCAGIIGALLQNSRLGLMRAKGNFKIATEKVLNNNGSGAGTWISNGWEHALTYSKEYIAKGWNVIWSNSFGGSPGGGAWSGADEILKRAVDAGVIIFAAVGNSGSAGQSYPGNSPHTIGVGATDINDAIAYFSGVGPYVDFSGAGVGILSCDKTETGLATFSGTSMATPMVAAATGLALKGNDLSTQSQVYALHRNYVTDVGEAGKDNKFGWGIPKLSKYPVNAAPPTDPPTDPGEPPTDPPTDPPTEPKPGQPIRTLAVTVDREFKVAYSYGDVLPRQFKVRVSPEFKTKLWAEEAIDKVVAATVDFFTNRGFYSTNEFDLFTLAGWVAYFYELILRTQLKVDINPTSITIEDDRGRKLVKDNPLTGLKTLSNDVKTYKY